MYKKSVKYSFIASFSIMVFLFTFITSTAYGATTTATKIGTEFIEPTGLAVDSSGDNIYVAENSGIKKINISSNTTTAAAVSVTHSSKVALDSSDNIYVLYSSDDKIYKTNKDGITTTLEMSNDGVSNPYGMALDSSDNIYVVDSGDSGDAKITKFNSNGNLIGNPIGLDNVNSINEVAVDSIGNIYAKCFTKDAQCVINKLKSDGTSLDTIFSGDNNRNDMHVAVDSSNNVYISKHDKDNNKNIIYKMKTSGEMEVYASYESEYDINGMAVDKSGNIYVIEDNCVKKITVSPELKIDTANPPNGTVGTAYSYTFTSTGGIGEKTYAVKEGSLPSGLTLSEEGTLSGIPTVAGNKQFTITATDSATPTASTSSTTVNLTISVAPLQINTTNPPNPTLNTAYSYTFKSTGGIGTKTYAVTEGYLPGGLSLSADGTLSGTPTSLGNNKFIVTATDSATPTASTSSTTVNLTVLAANSSGGSSSGSGSGSSGSSADSSGGSSSGSGSGSSNSGSSTSSSSSDSGSAQVTSIAIATGTVAGGTSSDAAIQIPVQITTEPDGTQKATLEINEDIAGKMSGLLKKPEEDKVKIDLSHGTDGFSAVVVLLPQSTTDLFAREQKSLELATPNGGVTIPQQTMQNLKLSGKDNLSFQFTPVRDTSVQEAIRTSVGQQLGSRAQIAGPPIDISTNMPYGNRVIVDLPVASKIKSPAQAAGILEDFATYVAKVEHSDGETLFQKPDRLLSSGGQIIAQFPEVKFSRFTIIKLSQETTSVGTWENDEQGWKYTKNGEPVTGWNQIGGYWYLMDSTGIMQTGWQQKDSNWYYFYDNGTMASNTVIDGYKLDEKGDMLYDQNL